MDRKSVAPHTGMIFVFDGDGPVEFWMKDTLEPLDMIFVGADGKVRRIYANVPVVAAGVGDDANSARRRQREIRDRVERQAKRQKTASLRARSWI